MEGQREGKRIRGFHLALTRNEFSPLKKPAGSRSRLRGLLDNFSAAEAAPRLSILAPAKTNLSLLHNEKLGLWCSVFRSNFLGGLGFLGGSRSWSRLF